MVNDVSIGGILKAIDKQSRAPKDFRGRGVCQQTNKMADALGMGDLFFGPLIHYDLV